EGITEIEGFLNGEDNMATVACLRQMGVNIEINKDYARIGGVGKKGLRPPKDVLYCGNSGTTMRLLCGLLAGQEFDSILSGDESLQKRPMKRVIQPLELMGACISAQKDGLHIKGRHLVGIDYKMPIHSAQVKSAIILAGLYAQGKTNVIELGEGLTRNHTENMMHYMIQDGVLKSRKISVPGDFSSAAFFVVLGLLMANEGLMIKGVGLNPTRTGLLTALRAMGGHIQTTIHHEIGGEAVGDIFVKKSRLKAIDLKGDLVPLMIDEIPIFAVAAAFATGTTTIQDAGELAIKESNRIVTISQELAKMGAKIAPTQEGLVIDGVESLHGAELDSHGDHRVAMAMAIAANSAQTPSTIKNAECMNISFPGFEQVLISSIK
ncbi:MAG: 3-phosphoshikimate 1-carboxyvinyltransferase, partial [Defluviitaleaceae bacterium]|nr:3-phosphoshikimate 1-carboxyvinyltransferase [Defluviitaleaceae bacterium]